MNINNLKKLVKNCVYEEEGIVCMNNDYYSNIIQRTNNLQSKIEKAVEYYEMHQQECVIGRNKDNKLIKEYYLPAQCSKKLYEFLKEDK